MGTSTNEDLQSILQEINKLSAERDELVRRIVRQSKKGLIDTREVRVRTTAFHVPSHREFSPTARTSEGCECRDQ